MPLTDEEIRKIAHEMAAQLEIKCQCGLSEEARKEMSHLMGMIKDIGGGKKGDYSRGIETIREMGKKYNRMSRTSEYISRALMWLFLASMFGGAIYLLKKGAVAVIQTVK